MTSCPFGAKSKPCPEAEVYAGPTPQKQGTAYCPLHGRFALQADDSPAPEANDAVAASPEPEAPVTKEPKSPETGGGKVVH